MQPSDAFKLRKAFFHALGKANTEATQEVYESAYKSLGNITTKDVWLDHIDYCSTESDADNFVSANPDIVKKYVKVTLKPVPGSNNQAWYYEDPSGKWIRPWISPVDIPNEITNQPSYGFLVKLYQEDDTWIPPTLGVWIPDYYAGMIYFQEGYTPQDQGWGNIKATFYVYIGKTLDSESIGGSKYISSFHWEFTENDYTGNGKPEPNHVLFLKRDILKDPTKFKVLIDGTEHSFIFHDQRLYKQGSLCGNYYTQHIDINDYSVGSESGRKIDVFYFEEALPNSRNFELGLCRTDEFQIQDKSLPPSGSFSEDDPTVTFRCYLSDAEVDFDGPYTLSGIYTALDDPTKTFEVVRYYPTHVYCKQFPKNYDFYTNDNLVLELWKLQSDSGNFNNKRTYERGSKIILKNMFTTNSIYIENISTRPGIFMFRFLNVNTYQVSEFFGFLKISRLKIKTTDATFSNWEHKGFVLRMRLLPKIN